MYEFTRLKLPRDEFDNLVFMGEPPWWRNLDEYPPCWDKEKCPEKSPITEEQEWLSELCHTPLKDVARKVIEKGNSDNPTCVFENIKVIPRCDKVPWFQRHAHLSSSFSKSLMDKLWIRNLAPHEKKCAPNGTFYVEDGNHRALVYAVLLKFKQLDYEDVEAIHATSWDLASGILDYKAQPMSILEHNGKLQDHRHCKQEFKVAIGSTDVQIDTYRR